MSSFFTPGMSTFTTYCLSSTTERHAARRLQTRPSRRALPGPAVVDLSSYRTFGYFKALGTDTHGYQSLVTQALKSATRAQMEARGYRYADVDPDLLLNFN